MISRHAQIRITAVLIILVTCFIGLEGGYRSYKLWRYGMMDYPDSMSLGVFQPDRVYGWVLTKNFRSDSIPEKIRFSDNVKGYSKLFTFNRWGYRGKDFSPQKPPDTYRIVVFGGSTTMDTDSADPDAWPAVLEKKLEADEGFKAMRGVRHVEVINAGVGGWRTREGLLRLKSEVRHFSPDLILVAFNWNDPIEGLKGFDPDAPISWEDRGWWYRSALFQNLYIRYLRLQGHNEQRYLAWAKDLKRDRPWAKVYVRNILEMQTIATEIQAKALLVNLPGLCRKVSVSSSEHELVVTRTRVTSENFEFYAEIKAIISELLHDLGRKHEMPVLDASAYFESFSDEARLALFTDEMHFTDAGAREVAQALYLGLTGTAQ